jgi:uncharacterized protein (TIGR03435 family)
MLDANDMELVREYVRLNSETAFAELVRRHINLVYSSALRHVGVAASAEEITQAVFIILARKAASLRPETILEGWLYETARLTALSFRRGERRRQLREQEAYMQSTLDENSASDAVWHQLAPLLDEAMARLGQKDRDAVILRFFKDQSVREVAAALRVSEPAAQRRVLRALEKLRKFFTKRGVSSTTVIIAGTISANSVQAAPMALAKSVTAVAIAKGAAASGSTLTLIKGALKIMAWSKAKTAVITSVGLLLAVGTMTVVVNEFPLTYDPWKHIGDLNREIIAIATPFNEKLVQAHGQLPMSEMNKNSKDIEDVYAKMWKNISAGVSIRPTHFLNGDGGAMRYDYKDFYIGTARPFSALLALAYEKTNYYEFPSTRMVLPADLPTGSFDYLVYVPDYAPNHGLEKFQEQIKTQFSLVAYIETRETPVLVLKLKNPAAAGLKPLPPGAQASGKGDIRFGSAKVADLLETDYFHQPVVDEAKLPNTYFFILPWKQEFLDSLDKDEGIPVTAKPLKQKEKEDMDLAKKTLLDEYGLELVPTNMPIEMLVVEKAQ